MENVFGKNLLLLRKREKLTQAQLGKKLGVTPLMILQYEQGRNFPCRKGLRTKLPEVLNCTEQDLYGYSDGYYAATLKLKAETDPTQKGVSDIHSNNLINEKTQRRAVDKHILEKFPKGQILQIKDDKMDKLIPVNSYCYITKEKKIINYDNKVCAYTLDGIKIDFGRFRFLGIDDSISIVPQSNNAKNEIISLCYKNLENFQIFGQVVWFSKDFEVE